MSPVQIEMRATEETIDWAHDALGLNYREIGSVLQAHERTVMRWKSRQTLASPRHRRRMEDLRELRHLLREVFGDEQGANLWLHSSVPALRGRTPISYIRAGRIGRVAEILATFQAGAFT
jgi:uncharacterized protein (DUF2384 family)